MKPTMTIRQMLKPILLRDSLLGSPLGYAVTELIDAHPPRLTDRPIPTRGPRLAHREQALPTLVPFRAVRLPPHTNRPSVDHATRLANARSRHLPLVRALAFPIGCKMKGASPELAFEFAKKLPTRQK
jgi:hypothetical protein